MKYKPTPEGHQIYFVTGEWQTSGFTCGKGVFGIHHWTVSVPLTFEKLVMLRTLYPTLNSWSCSECEPTLFTQFQCYDI